ncbi:TPA: ead/Ea22-like family protein [Klebsiella pneumoniae]|nr:ead/Ea22-like family protein [Klebsiella pneumoniae]
MTDITELAQSLKAAAVRVIKNYDSEWFEAGHQICTVHKSKINLISLANPVNVLALVEALEKAQIINAAQDDHINQQQDRIDQLEKGHQEAAKQINSWRRMAKQNIAEREKDIAELDAARQRIAELESRTVTVKLPQAVSAGGQGYQEKVERILTAAGIKWEAE